MNASKKAGELMSALAEHIETQKELLEEENKRLLARSRKRALEIGPPVATDSGKQKLATLMTGLGRLRSKSGEIGKSAYRGVGRIVQRLRNRAKRRSDKAS